MHNSVRHSAVITHWPGYIVPDSVKLFNFHFDLHSTSTCNSPQDWIHTNDWNINFVADLYCQKVMWRSTQWKFELNNGQSPPPCPSSLPLTLAGQRGTIRMIFSSSLCSSWLIVFSCAPVCCSCGGVEGTGSQRRRLIVDCQTVSQLKWRLRGSDIFPSPMCQKRNKKKNLHTVQSWWQPGCQTARHGRLESGVCTNHARDVCEQHKLCCCSSPQLEPLATGMFSKRASRTGSLYRRWMLLLWLKWIPLCGRTCSERRALYRGMMAWIQRLTPPAKKTCRIILIGCLFFFFVSFFLCTSLTFSSTLTVRGRAQSLRMHGIVFRRLMHSNCMGEHELEWALYRGQYICWMMRWTHPRLLHLALMNKLRRGRRVISKQPTALHLP